MAVSYFEPRISCLLPKSGNRACMGHIYVFECQTTLCKDADQIASWHRSNWLSLNLLCHGLLQRDDTSVLTSTLLRNSHVIAFLD